MKRAVTILTILAVCAVVLAGCGDFQQRAAEIQTRIDNAEENAQLAADAAARNAGRILELEQRVSDLEAELGALQTESSRMSDEP